MTGLGSALFWNCVRLYSWGDASAVAGCDRLRRCIPFGDKAGDYSIIVVFSWHSTVSHKAGMWRGDKGLICYILLIDKACLKLCVLQAVQCYLQAADL